jgi:DNA-directed RNA polymerase specialized sigma24 family protein
MSESAPIATRSASATRDGKFQTTQWHIVLQARGREGTQQARTALDALCRAYWYPLYAFARRQGRSQHNAQDLTQGFFAYMLEKDLFGDADPALGKLRTFLLTAFTRFISRENLRATAQKRGGGQHVISLDEEFDDGEKRFRLEAATKITPEEIFARSWATSLLDAAKAQVLRKEAAAGRQAMFVALEPFLERDRDATITYESMAAHLGLTQDALRKAVSRLRERYKQAIRDQVANTLNAPSEKEIDAEMRFLRAALS